jgi:hypothetical protein
MFSETCTIEDVKNKLVNDYTFYSFASDDDYDEFIESISEDVEILYFYPKIGKTGYEIIEAKDMVGLTDTETYLYWAEVYAICYEFLKFKEVVAGQLQTASQESIKVEGYSYSSGTSGSTGSSGNFSKRGYYNNFLKYFKLAGYDFAGLERTCTIFGTSDENTLDSSLSGTTKNILIRTVTP